MLNNPKVSITHGTNRKTILVDEFNSTALSCVVANTGVEVDGNGKKIIKAGTPVTGDLTERNTPFTVDKTGANPVGVILHDVDVTDGNANSQVVIFGFIDISKLDDEVVGIITTAAPKLTMIKLVK